MAFVYADMDDIRLRFLNEEALARCLNIDTGIVDEEKAEQYYDKAVAWVNQKLERRYELPLDISNELTAEWMRSTVTDYWEIFLLVNGNRLSDAKKLYWEKLDELLMRIADGEDDIPGIGDSPVGTGLQVAYGAGDATLVSDGGFRLSSRTAWRGL